MSKEGVGTTQVLASSIAAIGAAWIGSRFGIAGTTLGAGVASVISMGGSTLVQRSLERTHRTLAGQIQQRRTGALSVQDAPTERISMDRLQQTDKAVTAHLPRRKLTWKWAVVGAAGVFVLTLGVLTLLELGLGHPLSGGNEGTTLSGYLGHPTSHPQAPPVPETTTRSVPVTTTQQEPVTTFSSPTTTVEPTPSVSAPFTTTPVPTTTTPAPTTLLVPAPTLTGVSG